MRLHRVVAMAVGICLATPLVAQGRALTVSAAPSFVRFGRLATFSALALSARVSWERASGPGLELSAVTVLPFGTVSALALCPPSPSACVLEVRSPSALFGGLVAASKDLGRPWLRGSVGAGVVFASGVVGGSSSAVAFQSGVDATWLRARGGAALVGSVRGVVLSRDIVGMRAVLVPGIGVKF